MNFFGGLARWDWGCPSGLKGLVGRTTRCKKFRIFLARKNRVVVQCQDWTKIEKWKLCSKFSNDQSGFLNKNDL